MTIRTRLALSAIICIGLALFLAAFLIFTAQQVREATEKHKLVNELTKGISELQILTNDYLLHYEERAETQWYQRHDSLTEHLALAVVKDPEGKVIYDSFKIKDVFTQLTAAIKERQQLGSEESGLYEEREDRLVGQLLIESQAMVSDAYELQLLAQTRLDATQRRGILTVISFASTIAAVVAAGFLWIRRSVLSPLVKLQTGTKIIGSGDLDYRLGVTTRDEIGQLSRAFDQMTEELGKKTTSIDNLNKEISERKQMERELLQTKELIDTALDSQSDTFFLFELATGKAIRWNRAFREIIGYTDEEISELPAPASYYSPEDIEKAVVAIQQIMEEGMATVELELICKDGHKVTTEYQISAIYKDNGEIRYVVSIGRDITERKEAEAALHESEERFRSLVENINDFVWEVDANGIYTYASPKVKDLLGYQTEEVIGKTPFDFMPPEEAKRVAEEFQTIVESQSPFTRLENINLRKDGRLAVLETSGMPIFDLNGQLRGYRGIDRDITERKETEEEMRIKDNAITSSINAIALADLEGNLTYVNPSFLELWGYDDDREVLGKSALEFWQIGERATEVIGALQTKGGWKGELVGRKKDGTTFDVQLPAF